MLEDQLNENALALHLQRWRRASSARPAAPTNSTRPRSARSAISARSALHPHRQGHASRRRVVLAISPRLASPIIRYLGTPMPSEAFPIAYGMEEGQPALAMLP